MLKTIVALFAAALLITSCTKKGDQGPAGTSGTNGTNGTNGTANISAGYTTVNPADWTNAGSGLYYRDITDDSVTQAVIDKGLVSVFYQGSVGVWVAMPVSIYNSPTVSLYYGFNYSLGGVRLFIQNSAGGTISGGAITFKIVVIPPMVHKANPNTNWNDYNQVMQVMSTKAVSQ